MSGLSVCFSWGVWVVDKLNATDIYYTHVPYHDVTMETEGQPVGEHSLCYSFRSSEEKFRRGVSDCLVDQVRQKTLQDTVCVGVGEGVRGCVGEGV